MIRVGVFVTVGIIFNTHAMHGVKVFRVEVWLSLWVLFLILALWLCVISVGKAVAVGIISNTHAMVGV